MQKFAAAIMFAIGAVASIQKPYSGGEIYSKETFKYGRFSATVRPSQVQGTGTSFYLYSHHNDETHHQQLYRSTVWEEWNSISYFPIDQESPFFTKMSRDMNQSWERHVEVENHGSFHLYEIEWTPDYLTFSIDGQEIRHLEGDEVQALHEEQNIGITLMSNSDELSLDLLANETNLPTYAEFGYVEVYDYDVEKDEFNLRFKDNFNYFESQRWTISEDKTADGMSSTFQSENINVEQGMLRFKLDKVSADDSDDESDDDSDSSDEDSHEDSDNESDFHVLPSPKHDTLDMAIEKATRVVVTMARTGLDQFSQSMSQYLMHQ